MDRREMEKRTKAFALRIMKLVRALLKTEIGRVVGRQVLRSGTSVGSNYRAAGCARSRAEFVAKLGIVEEEANETVYWLELIMEDGLLPRKRVEPLWNEGKEILAIVIASKKSAKA
ncbi:MAG: four helix bundle protein [Phycisphaerales bacterium]